MVPMGRIELPTSPLPRECSTTEPHGQLFHTRDQAHATLERETGIEPASLAWKAKVLPLNYSRALDGVRSQPSSYGSAATQYLKLLVERAGFEPAYSQEGRFTVCCH